MNLTIYQDKTYQTFTKKLVSTKYEIIGVRLPILKRLAKNITLSELKNLHYFEDYMLYGFVIGREKNLDVVKEALTFYVPLIDNWSLCDSLVCSLKITNRYKKEMLDYIIPYKNKSTYEKRFLIVMLLRYYIKEDIDQVLTIIKDIKTGEYYVDMAIAWLLAEASIDYEEQVIEYLQKEKSDFIVNKTISKARESYRVSHELKNRLLQYKR